MSYKLNKKECEALDWYIKKHDLKLTLSILPIIIYTTNTRGGAILVHINVIVELYEMYKKG